MATVEARALGRKRPLVPSWSIDAGGFSPGADGPLRLADLIEAVVRSEVRAFKERAHARTFIRALSESEIADGAAAGKIDMGGREQNAEVDEDAAVQVALEAFGDGLYLVILDEEELTSLDQEIAPAPDSRIVFLRLTFLAGA